MSVAGTTEGCRNTVKMPGTSNRVLVSGSALIHTCASVDALLIPAAVPTTGAVAAVVTAAAPDAAVPPVAQHTDTLTTSTTAATASPLTGVGWGETRSRLPCRGNLCITAALTCVAALAVWERKVSHDCQAR
jgi:hypothetical protein